jgi:hypothetical protein
MSKFLGSLLILAGMSLVCSAKLFTVPEIDPSGAVNAAMLISGAVLVLRSRRKK